MVRLYIVYMCLNLQCNVRTMQLVLLVHTAGAKQICSANGGGTEILNVPTFRTCL